MQFKGKKKKRQAKLRLSNGLPDLKMSFIAEALSPFGGLPLLEKIAAVTGLIDGMASKMKDHRTQSLIDYNKAQLLKQWVLLVATGNPDTNDADKLRYDPSLMVSLGLDPDGSEGLASQPTMARFLNDAKEADLEAMADWLVEFYMREHQKCPRRIYLYCDGTAIETYGKQEGAIYRGGKYKKEMLFPLTVFDQDGWLLAMKLRTGKEAESKTIGAVLEGLVGKLREKWLQIEIVLVVDGAFKSPELLNWCEKNSVFYIAGYVNNAAIQKKIQGQKRLIAKGFKKQHSQPRFTGKDGDEKIHDEHVRIRSIKDAKERMEEEKKLSGRMVRMIIDEQYKATTWAKADPERRLIIRLYYTDKGLDTRCLLTNFECYAAEKLYEMYCQRGTSEQWIGQMKNCFNLKLNSQSFNANQLRLYIHGMAYMLLWYLRKFLSCKFNTLSLVSIRKLFVEIVVAVSKKSKKILWQLTNRYPYQTEFLRVTRKLQAWAS